jgi:hypothetical protein
MEKLIMSEVVDSSPGVQWSDIAGTLAIGEDGLVYN